MCTKRKRRRKKQAALSKFMKRRNIIMIQEVHGSEALLRTWVDTQPYPYKLFFSEFKDTVGDAQQAIGGVATLISWFTPMQFEQLQPDQLPTCPQ